MSNRRWIRVFGFAAALVVATSATVAGQEVDPDSAPDPKAGTEEADRGREQAETKRRHPPEGPLVLSLATGRVHFVSSLPGPYLDGLTGRIVHADHRLDDRLVLGLRLGVRITPKWMLEAEAIPVDTKFGAANLRVDVLYRGVNIFHTLLDFWYVTVGAGTVSYDFKTSLRTEFPRTNTDFAANVGIGLWRRTHFLGKPFTWRTELRNYVSWLTVPGLETRAQHHLGVLSGLEFSFP